MFIRKCLTQIDDNGIVYQALKGGNLGTPARNGIGNTGTDRATLDEDRTGAAYTVLTPNMRGCKKPLIPKEISKVRTRLYIGTDKLSVNLNF